MHNRRKAEQGKQRRRKQRKQVKRRSRKQTKSNKKTKSRKAGKAEKQEPKTTPKPGAKKIHSHLYWIIRLQKLLYIIHCHSMTTLRVLINVHHSKAALKLRILRAHRNRTLFPRDFRFVHSDHIWTATKHWHRATASSASPLNRQVAQFEKTLQNTVSRFSPSSSN